MADRTTLDARDRARYIEIVDCAIAAATEELRAELAEARRKAEKGERLRAEVAHIVLTEDRSSGLLVSLEAACRRYDKENP